MQRYVVLDDDPTGVQTLAGIRVLLRWDAGRVRAALEGRRSVHLITNSRALSPARARALVSEAARDAIVGAPDARVVLRGDSTLRGHLLEEYEAVREVVYPGSGPPPLLLVPALPSAGRITIDGVHLIQRDGRRVPLHDTEYARDGAFSYGNAALLAWAEERSDGLLAARAGREVSLAELRGEGPQVIALALTELAAAGRPAVLAPDAETGADLEAIAAGYAAAIAAGVPVVVRCAPAFAGVLAGTTASGLVDAPQRGGVLVVCGSYVPTSTRQLARLAATHRGGVVEVDVRKLASGDPDGEILRAARAASTRLVEHGLAVLATPRERPESARSLAAGERIAAGLARAAGMVEPRPAVVVAKGGITSAVTLRLGFEVEEADVIGPVLPGVSHWRAGRLDYLVVPGNVGEDDLLVELVGLLGG